MQSFSSYGAAKRALGGAQGCELHNIVEQCQAHATRAGFTKRRINTVDNITMLPTPVHQLIVAYYARIIPGTDLSQRDIMSALSWWEQYNSGLKIIEAALVAFGKTWEMPELEIRSTPFHHEIAQHWKALKVGDYRKANHHTARLGDLAKTLTSKTQEHELVKLTSIAGNSLSVRCAAASFLLQSWSFTKIAVATLKDVAKSDLGLVAEDATATLRRFV